MNAFISHREFLAALFRPEPEWEDEEAKLNVNAASEYVILELMKILKKGGMRFVNDERKTARAIAAYRAEKSNGRYEFQEELLLAEGVREEDFINLSPYLTVYPRAQGLAAVNLNTVNGAVLQALIHSVPGDVWKKQDLTEKILEWREACGNESGSCWEETDFSPYAFALKLGLPLNPGWMSLLNHILPYFKASSGTFRVYFSSADGGKRAEVVLARGKEGSEHEILDWREY